MNNPKVDLRKVMATFMILVKMRGLCKNVKRYIYSMYTKCLDQNLPISDQKASKHIANIVRPKN